MGTFETIGMDGECSTANKELSPPSYKRCEDLDKNMQHLKTESPGIWLTPCARKEVKQGKQEIPIKQTQNIDLPWR